jgi:hypothetical protein
MSSIQQSFENFCNNGLTSYLNGKKTPQEFTHFYWYTLKPMADYYSFPIPDAIHQQIEYIKDNWNKQ